MQQTYGKPMMMKRMKMKMKITTRLSPACELTGDEEMTKMTMKVTTRLSPARELPGDEDGDNDEDDDDTPGR